MRASARCTHLSVLFFVASTRSYMYEASMASAEESTASSTFGAFGSLGGFGGFGA